jgi:cellulose synthase/poly-beta-1,6-N-acetylglucosamine synthase-like glycosyltransferase
MIKYSFIIPVKEINDYIRESVPKILEIKRNDYEIIIYPDEVSEDKWDKTRQIATGHSGPATKRSLAARDAQGKILVFIDDDAYPAADFLDKLDQDFANEEVVAVGGPAMTPASNSFWQKVSGAVFLSSLSGGFPERYIPIGCKREVIDWPSVNLSVRKEAFNLVGGFNSEYWPGEDTKFCLDLIEKTKKKIIYDPQLIVWHHRRSGLIKHLKQEAGYGLHRGFFAKKYPQSSCKFKYFIPSFFLVFIVLGGWLSFFSDLFFKIYLTGWILYLMAIAKSFLDIYKYERNILIILNSLYYIFLTHIVYGFRFIQGFVFTRELKSKLR